MPEEETRERRKPLPAGVGLIFGVAIGTVLFALTENAVWIGLGAGLGILVGAASAKRS
jgi:hypothetical protein